MDMEEAGSKTAEIKLHFKEDLSMYDLEERNRKSEARIAELEEEVEKRKQDYEELEAKFRELEAKYKCAELELKALKTENNGSIGHGNSVENKNNVEIHVVADREGDEENVTEQLMAENCALECEKRKAENDVVMWKEKFKELELQVSRMNVGTVKGEKPKLDVKYENVPDIDGSVSGLEANSSVPCKGINNFPASGSPYKDRPCSHTPFVGKEGLRPNVERKFTRKVKRLLSFNNEKLVSNKNGPSTPAMGRPSPFNVINILDSDDESDIHGTRLPVSSDPENRKVYEITETKILDDKKDEIEDYEEDFDEFRDETPRVLISKRKRCTRIVTSDSESDKDDNVPISELKKTRHQAKKDANSCKVFSSPTNDNSQQGGTRSRRRLATLRQCEEKVKPERSSTDGESEGVQSESESKNSSSFIDDGSIASDGSTTDSVTSNSETDSDGDANFGEILCKLRRSENGKSEWEFEADMLAAFGKDIELCMRAVCALYRQQTSDEQISKEAKYGNRRGFSKIDALRGTELAEFLTNGDPQGDLKRTKKQLEDRGTSAVELCRTLATRYSKQLFEIYKNKEDPLFLPF